MLVIFKMVDVIIVGEGVEELCMKMEEIFSKVNGGKCNVGLYDEDMFDEDNMDVEEFVSRIISKEGEDVYGYVEGLMERGDDMYKVEVWEESNYNYLK